MIVLELDGRLTVCTGQAAIPQALSPWPSVWVSPSQPRLRGLGLTWAWGELLRPRVKWSPSRMGGRGSRAQRPQRDAGSSRWGPRCCLWARLPRSPMLLRAAVQRGWKVRLGMFPVSHAPRERWSGGPAPPQFLSPGTKRPSRPPALTPTLPPSLPQA